MVQPDSAQTVTVTTTSQLIPDNVAGYAKLVSTFLVSVVGALLLVLPADGSFGDLTLVQWLGVIAVVLGAPAATGITANRVKPFQAVSGPNVATKS